MSENVAISQRPKHVNSIYRFVQEFIFDNFIKIIFVKNIDNYADIFKKNIGEELHSIHGS